MPAQFWALTYREFNLKYFAFIRAENRELKRLAQLALWTDGDKYATHKRSPERLMGWQGPGPIDLYPVKKWLVQE
jgi:hypothetical protein